MSDTIATLIRDLRKRGHPFVYDGSKAPLMIVDHSGGGYTVAYADMSHPRWKRT